MIRWRRIEAGRCESVDKRFEVKRIYSRAYQGSWVLIDRNATDNPVVYDGYTRLSCQLKAEDLKYEGRMIGNGQKAEQKDDTSQRE